MVTPYPVLRRGPACGAVGGLVPEPPLWCGRRLRPPVVWWWVLGNPLCPLWCRVWCGVAQWRIWVV